MNQVEADLSYIRKSLEDFLYHGKHVLPAPEPMLVKVFYPHVAAQYFGMKYIDDPHVKMSKAGPPESAKTVEAALQIAAKGMQAVQVFRAKSTSFYQWDPKLKLLSPAFAKPDFKEWLATIKTNPPVDITHTYPELCSNKIRLAKEWPHPPEQLNVMVELVATLYESLKGVLVHKSDMEYLAIVTFQIVIECQINDIPDPKTPKEVFDACEIALDKARDTYIQNMGRAFSKIKSEHFRDVLKYLGFVIWLKHEYRSPQDPESIRRVKHLNGKYKIYCSVIDPLMKQ